MISNIALASAIEKMFANTDEPIDKATKDAFLNILEIRSQTALLFASVVTPKHDTDQDVWPTCEEIKETSYDAVQNSIGNEDDSVVPPFEISPTPLDEKEVERLLHHRVQVVSDSPSYDTNLLGIFGFNVVKFVSLKDERKKIYITDTGIKIAFARGSHGAYGIFGPAINKTPSQIAVYNECDYWVHARYSKDTNVGEYIDGAAFDIRGSTIKWENGDVVFISRAGDESIDNKASTWFKVVGLDKIEVQNELDKS